MSDTEQIKALILSSKRLAAGDMAAIKAASPLTKAFFCERLRAYVLHKYMLDPAGELPESFSALTDLSLARSMKISPELVKEYDLARSCDGASSAMAKKVLLFMAIQRELGIELPAMESARVTSLAALAELAWGELLKAPAWEGKLEA